MCCTKSRNLLDNYTGTRVFSHSKLFDLGQTLCHGPSQRKCSMIKAEFVDQVAVTVQLPKHQTETVIC